MRERHTLGYAGGAGCIQDLGERVPVGYEGLQRTWIEEGIEAIRAAAVEVDGRHGIRHERSAYCVAEREFDAAVAEDVGDGRARQLVVDRHGDRPHAHDAEIAGDELDPVLRENTNPSAGPDTAALQTAADAVAQGIELKRGELPRSRLFA